ncbi:Glutamate receptor 1 [Chionoecetes opilio]|uniref:Glutamate receptor 1 n=1 Tax=Chionoecetes opilio TaxID=41210 RepID=A0A8J5D253_CHIOP|nr:Glutamate receptor 1 [Chionoecetes opilio]
MLQTPPDPPDPPALFEAGESHSTHWNTAGMSRRFGGIPQGTGAECPTWTGYDSLLKREFRQPREARERWSNKFVVLDCGTKMAKDLIIGHVRDVQMGRRNYHYLFSGLKLKNLTCAHKYAVTVSNRFDMLGALVDLAELWDTFKRTGPWKFSTSEDAAPKKGLVRLARERGPPMAYPGKHRSRLRVAILGGCVTPPGWHPRTCAFWNTQEREPCWFHESKGLTRGDWQGGLGDRCITKSRGPPRMLSSPLMSGCSNKEGRKPFTVLDGGGTLPNRSLLPLGPAAGGRETYCLCFSGAKGHLRTSTPLLYNTQLLIDLISSTPTVISRVGAVESTVISVSRNCWQLPEKIVHIDVSQDWPQHRALWD